MAVLLKKIFHVYSYVFNELADPRAEKYPLMSSPFPVLAICAGYLYFVLKLGPKLMENRKPFNIKKFIIVFNIAQILVCAFIVSEFIRLCSYRISWTCEPIDYSYEAYPMLQVFYGWLYFSVKVLDLLDTVFFILRKKNSQITFLHLYHHTGMVILTWIGCKFISGGHGLFIGFANCIVHTFMYFYYLMSIWDERFKKSLWWKKYITQLQMCQFFFLIVIFGQTLFYPSCQYPKWVTVFFVPQNIFMFILFADFYYKAYMKKKEPSEVTTKTDETMEHSKKEEQFVETLTNNSISNSNKDDQKSK